MNEILDQVGENSDNSPGDAGSFSGKSPRSEHRPLGGSETQTIYGPTRRFFWNTLTQNSGNHHQSESFSFARFADGFDDLRHPSSPLHEF